MRLAAVAIWHSPARVDPCGSACSLHDAMALLRLEYLVAHGEPDDLLKNA
ncbi:MAG: hypothetical protein PUA61_04880 [Succinatimonas hippei]|nr:hypothetical protein [Succinatimonas hippei]